MDSYEEIMKIAFQAEEALDEAVIAKHRARVDIGRAAAEARELAPRLLGGNRRHHLGQGLRQEGPKRRCRGLYCSEAVEEGHALLGLAKLDEKPLKRLPIASRESGLRDFLQPFAEHCGTLLEALEEALPLVTDLQVREATDDRERREPDGSDEARGYAQAAPRWTTAEARRSRRWCTAPTPSTR